MKPAPTVAAQPGTTVQVYGALAELPASALALLDAAEPACLYDGAGWYDNLLREVDFGPGHRPAFWVVSEAAQARLLLPLLRPPGQWRSGQSLQALGNYYTPWWQPLVHPAAGPAHWQALARAWAARGPHQRPDVLSLGPWPDQGGQAPALVQALHAAGFSCHWAPAFGNWHEDTRQGFAAYWAARPGALRSTAKRAAKRFAQAGGQLEVARGENPAQLERLLDAYQQVYRQSWKPQEPHPGFMPGLMRLAAQRGWLRLGVAWLQGRPIAAHLWLVQGRRAEIYKLAYAEDAAPWSPGTLLGQHLMQHVIDTDGVQEVDYLMGDDAYKQLWMGQRRERWTLQAFNRRSLHGWAHLARRALRPSAPTTARPAPLHGGDPPG